MSPRGDNVMVMIIHSYKYNKMCSNDKSFLSVIPSITSNTAYIVVEGNFLHALFILTSIFICYLIISVAISNDGKSCILNLKGSTDSPKPALDAS